MRLRKRKDAAVPVTAAQAAAALKLARDTLAADRLAVERYAGMAVPRQVPEDAGAALAGRRLTMAAPSVTETPTVAGYGVALGNGVVHAVLFGRDGHSLGGSLNLIMAREFARTILQVAGEEAGDGDTQ